MSLVDNNIEIVYQSSCHNGVGTLRESSLHASLKEYYKRPGDLVEERVDGYIIDIVHDNFLIEIQTQNFYAIKKKLENLVENHKVLLVYPVISDKWIVYQNRAGSKVLRRRLSPKHCSHENIFDELIRIPHLIAHPNLSVETTLIQIEEIRRKCGKGSWRRRGWNIYDKRLVNVLGTQIYHTPYDFLEYIPRDISVPFTNFDLAKKLKKPIKLVRKMTYCLRKMGTLRMVGKKGKSYLFSF